MSQAVSARYDVPCPICDAGPQEPCRTRQTRRVTDTHHPRIVAQWRYRSLIQETR